MGQLVSSQTILALKKKQYKTQLKNSDEKEWTQLFLWLALLHMHL